MLQYRFWPRPWRLAPPPGGHGEAAEPMQKLIADGGVQLEKT